MRQLGRIVSDHLDSGRPLSDDDLELITSLGPSGEAAAGDAPQMD